MGYAETDEEIGIERQLTGEHQTFADMMEEGLKSANSGHSKPLGTEQFTAGQIE